MAILVIQRILCKDRASTFSKDQVHLHLHARPLPSVPRLVAGPAEMGPGSTWDFPENAEPRVKFSGKAWIDLCDTAGLDQHLGTIEVTPTSGAFEVEVGEAGRYVVRGFVIADPVAPAVSVVRDGLARTLPVKPVAASFETQYFLDKDETVPLVVEIGGHGLGSRSLDLEGDLFKYKPLSSPTGLQQRLADLKCDPGVIDGIIGRRTRAAIAKFQERHHLEPTGEADEATLDAIARAFDALEPTDLSGQRRGEALYVPDNEMREVTPAKQAKRSYREGEGQNTFNTNPIIEFISFGRSHRYFAQDYPRYAPGYHAQLLREARVLLSTIQSDYALLNDIVAGDGSLGAWMTFGLDSMKTRLMEVWAGKGEPPPKPEEYDPLSNRVLDHLGKLSKKGPDGYGEMHAAGLEFMRVRFELQRMHRRVFQRVDDLIKTAEQGQAGAEKIESTSFTLLDMYGQVRFLGNANGLALYRIGILMVRASARGAGGALADRSRQAIFRDAMDTARPEIVRILTDWLMANVKKRIVKIPGQATPSEQLVELSIKVSLLVAFDFLDWELFEVERLSKSERDQSMSKWWDRLEPKLFDEIVGGLLDLWKTSKVKGLDAPEQAFRKKVIETIFDVLRTVLSKLNVEIMAMRKVAEQENRSTLDCVMADFGPMVLRILKDSAQSMAESWVEGKAKGKIESVAGVTSDQKDKGERLTPQQVADLNSPQSLGKVVRDGLASIKAQLKAISAGAKTPAVATKATPTEPLAKSTGQDEDRGAAKLPPAALTESQEYAQPQPGDKASKLPRDQRQQVEITPNPAPRSQPRVVVVEVASETNGPERPAQVVTLAGKQLAKTRAKQKSRVITAAPAEPAGEVKQGDSEPPDGAGPPAKGGGGGDGGQDGGGGGPPGGGPPSGGDNDDEGRGPKPTRKWKGNTLKEAEVDVPHAKSKREMKRIQEALKLENNPDQAQKPSRYNEFVARHWLEQEMGGVAIGIEDKETVGALKLSGLTHAQLEAAGNAQVARLNKLIGRPQAAGTTTSPSNLKCGDFIVPSAQRKGEVAFGDSKGKNTDFVHALRQVVASYGMYRAAMEQNGETTPIKPRFYLIMPAGARPDPEELYIHNGRVFVGDTPLVIDGGEVQVVVIEERIVNRPASRDN